MTSIRPRPVAGDSYEISKTPIRQIVEDADSGRIQLPNFQRTWRWPDDGIKDIVDSIGRGFPVGTLMYLEVGNNVNIDRLTIHGTPAISDEVVPKHLIMDGQQRITALYQTLFSGNPVHIKKDKKKDVYRLYFFDMVKALNGDIALSDAVVSFACDKDGNAISNDNKEYEDENFLFDSYMFPLNNMFCFREWHQKFKKYWEGVEGASEARSIADDFREVVIDAFTKTSLPIITLRDTVGMEDVAEIYKRINTTGVALDAFDLLIASYAARDFNLREDWSGERKGNGIKQELLKRVGKLSEKLEPINFLTAINMLESVRKNVRMKTTKDAYLNTPLEVYQEHRDDLVRGYAEAYDFVANLGACTSSVLPAKTVINILAVIFATVEGRSSSTLVLEKLKRWYWCSGFSNYYSVGVGAMAFTTDVIDIEAWVASDGGAVARVVDDTKLWKSRITRNTKTGVKSLNRIMSTFWLSSNALDPLVGRSLLGESTLSNSIRVMKVVDEDWCRENGVPEEMYASPLNNVYIMRSSKRRLGASIFPDMIQSEKLNDDNFKQKIRSNLMSQGINLNHLEGGDILEFFDEREKDIESRINSATGHRLLEVESIEFDVDMNLEANVEYKMRGCHAKGVILPDDTMVIVAGSIMAESMNDSCQDHLFATRDKLINSGKVKKSAEDGLWYFIEPYHFTSPSKAASVVSGRVSGRRDWKDINPIIPANEDRSSGDNLTFIEMFGD